MNEEVRTTNTKNPGPRPVVVKAKPTVSELVDRVDAANKSLRSGTAAYAALLRMTEAAAQNSPDPNATSAPVLEWYANLNGENVAVSSDLSLLPVEELAATLKGLMAIHSNQMFKATQDIARYAKELMDIFSSEAA